MSVTQLLQIFKPMGNEDERDGWAGAKIMLGNPMALINALKNYGDRIGKVKQPQIEKVRSIIANPDNRLDEIKTISKAAGGLFSWVKATVNLYDIHKKVEPLKEKLDKMTKKSIQTKEDLAKTEEELELLNKELAELEDNRQKKQARLEDLTASANLMAKRLNAAEKLISGLQRERDRWTEDSERLEDLKVKLIGDCLVCSSFLSYVGPFDFSFRKKMVFDHWMQDVRDKELPFNEKFTLESLLSSDVEISQWNSEGLPSDDLSV
jgi:dynein heavy chain